MLPLAFGVYWNHAIVGVLMAAVGAAILIEAVRHRSVRSVVLAAAALVFGAELLRSAVLFREVQITVLQLEYSGDFRNVYDTLGRHFAAHHSVWEDLSEADRVRCRVTRPLVLTPTLVSCEQLTRGSGRDVLTRAR